MECRRFFVYAMWNLRQKLLFWKQNDLKFFKAPPNIIEEAKEFIR